MASSRLNATATNVAAENHQINPRDETIENLINLQPFPAIDRVSLVAVRHYLGDVGASVNDEIPNVLTRLLGLQKWAVGRLHLHEGGEAETAMVF